MESKTREENSSHRAKKMLVWIGVASITMFFFGLTSAYIVLQADHLWIKDALPQAFSISSVIILVSSVTMFLAHRSAKNKNLSGAKMWLLATFVLGLGFSTAQYAGWTELWEQGRNFRSDIGDRKGEYGTDYVVMMKGEPVLYDNGNYYKPGDISFSEPINERVNSTFNISASFLSMFSALHLLHLAGGLIWLIVLLVKVFGSGINSLNEASISLGSIYWHFLDILWIYLFLFLLFIR